MSTGERIERARWELTQNALECNQEGEPNLNEEAAHRILRELIVGEVEAMRPAFTAAALSATHSRDVAQERPGELEILRKLAHAASNRDWLEVADQLNELDALPASDVAQGREDSKRLDFLQQTCSEVMCNFNSPDEWTCILRGPEAEELGAFHGGHLRAAIDAALAARAARGGVVTWAPCEKCRHGQRSMCDCSGCAYAKEVSER